MVAPQPTYSSTYPVIEWADLSDLALLLEPYDIEIEDVCLDDGLVITLNPNWRHDDPPLVLKVTKYARDPIGDRYCYPGTNIVAKTVQTIPMASLPTLTPRI